MPSSSPKIKLKNQLKARFDLDSWSLQALQHSVTIRYVEGLSADFKKTLKSAEKEAKEANERYKFCKTRATTLHNKAQALLEQSDPEVVNVVQNLAEEEMERTVDYLKAELEGEKASLEIAQGVNPAVIEQYKERLERLSSLKASIDDKEKKKADLEHKIKRLEVSLGLDGISRAFLRSASHRFRFFSFLCFFSSLSRRTNGFHLWKLSSPESVTNSPPLSKVSAALEKSESQEMKTTPSGESIFWSSSVKPKL